MARPWIGGMRFEKQWTQVSGASVQAAVASDGLRIDSGLLLLNY